MRLLQRVQPLAHLVRQLADVEPFVRHRAILGELSNVGADADVDEAAALDLGLGRALAEDQGV